MPSEDWIQRWKVAQIFYNWQTLIAGVLALLAGIGTVAATMLIARRQITASREETDRVIAATRAQTEATFKQTEATVRLEDLRKASEALAFHAMLEAAMARVLPGEFGADGRLNRRGPYRSPVHHQRRVRGVAGRLHQTRQPFDRRVSRPRTRDRQLRAAI